jgi:hypothetical protein
MVKGWERFDAGNAIGLTRCSCHRSRRGLSASFALRSNRKPDYSLAFVIDLSPAFGFLPHEKLMRSIKLYAALRFRFVRGH